MGSSLIRRFSLFFLISFLSPSVVLATMVLPLNLEQLSQRAERIFVGRCDSVAEEYDSNQMATTSVTYEVLDKIKGDLRSYETIRLYGFSKKTVLSEDGLLISRQPTPLAAYSFEPGTEEVLFLYKDSRLGFTSPVGFGQGRFEIHTLASGQKVVSNNFGNRILLKKSSSSVLKALKSANPDEPIGFDEFVATVKKVVSPR
ncbi:MAG: hypothetical protein Q7S98_07070 [Deltaproteobacteria bacterium]|nr:hypothetical protein [Deltaproteobacteria bacterium]